MNDGNNCREVARYNEVGPDGNLWFTNHGIYSPPPYQTVWGSIGRITPAGVVSNFADPNISSPQGITAGPDGNLWFTTSVADSPGYGSIGRITPAGVVFKFTGPGISLPYGIAAGPDGGIWFTDNSNNSIGRITAAHLL